MSEQDERDTQDHSALQGAGAAPSESQEKATVKTRVLRGLVTAAVVVLTVIGWAAIRASKGTLWLWDRKPAPTTTDYQAYTDRSGTFSVDLPSYLTVQEHIKNLPAEGGVLLDVRIHTAWSEKDGFGLSLTSYEWNVGESPKQFALDRLRDVVVGMGFTLSSTLPVERPGCTALRGFGRGTRNGLAIHQFIIEICVKDKHVFGLTVLSRDNTVDLRDRPAVRKFFATFHPLN